MIRKLFCFAWVKYASAASSYTMSLLPFNIEVRSTQDTNSVSSLNQEMLFLTENHMYEFFSNQKDLIDYFQTIELESTPVQLVSEVSSGTFSSTFSFSGDLILEQENDENITLLENQIRDFQLAAFKGKAQVEFLNYLQSFATDTSLSSATFAKMTFINAAESQNNKSRTNDILISCSIAFLVVSILIAAWSYYSIKIKKKKVTTRTTKSNLRKKPNLELAKTESMSPSNEGPYPTFFDGAASINTFLKNGGKSVITTNTIDVNGNIDMMAWKHSKASDTVPFETDLTMIASTSPNKTMEVPKDLEIGPNTRPASTRESKSNYLSLASLSYHNEARFESHSRRYHEKKSRTSRVTYR